MNPLVSLPLAASAATGRLEVVGALSAGVRAF
ncbi:hypothetical protein SAMN04515680_1681 [Leifsonia sp. 21MFCrub1.1]|nr:hypothetical protein SAMN04515680_1681 [Leifsonia sp. 21MFCrub1.1]